jgi:hypothetical protein
MRYDLLFTDEKVKNIERIQVYYATNGSKNVVVNLYQRHPYG